MDPCGMDPCGGRNLGLNAFPLSSLSPHAEHTQADRGGNKQKGKEEDEIHKRVED